MADREIVISRLISAPRELVFEAFIEVRHLAMVGTGGVHHHHGVMRGPDGADYQEWICWTEIAEPTQRG